MFHGFRLVIAGIALLVAAPAPATTIQVPAGAPTIQAGIDAAAPGDTVEVACGTYLEHSVVMKSGVVLRSATGDPACVTIDAQRIDRALYCQEMSGDTKVEAITLINGLASEGGGLWCVSSTMTIESCVFEGNEASIGGAIWCDIGEPTIRNCVFENNTGVEGGGVKVEDSPFVLESCVFYGNSAYEGGGLYLNNATGAVRNCTFYANSAPGGGHVFVAGSAAVPSIEHTILAYGAGCNAVVCAESSVSVSCSVVYGNIGGDWNWCLAGMQGVNGNFWADPDFCDGPGGDVSLRAGSPCAPPGVTGCGLVGALGVGCGPVSVEPFSWGQVKHLYRGE